MAYWNKSHHWGYLWACFKQVFVGYFITDTGYLCSCVILDKNEKSLFNKDQSNPIKGGSAFPWKNGFWLGSQPKLLSTSSLVALKFHTVLVINCVCKRTMSGPFATNQCESISIRGVMKWPWSEARLLTRVLSSGQHPSGVNAYASYSSTHLSLTIVCVCPKLFQVPGQSTAAFYFWATAGRFGTIGKVWLGESCLGC